MAFLAILSCLVVGALAQAVNPNKEISRERALKYWRQRGNQRPCEFPSDCRASSGDGAALSDAHIGAYCDHTLGGGYTILDYNPTTGDFDIDSTELLNTAAREDNAVGFPGICVACPKTNDCTVAENLGLIKDKQRCIDWCELDVNSDGVRDNLVLCSIENYMEDCGVEIGKENVVFCNGPNNDESKTGFCTACQVVDTDLDTATVPSLNGNDYPIFTNNIVRFHVVYRCELADYNRLHQILGTNQNANLMNPSPQQAYSDIELSNICYEWGAKVGCCSAGIPNGVAMCEQGSSGAHPGLASNAAQYDYEIDTNTNGYCGKRKCGDGSTEFPTAGICYKSPESTDGNACTAFGVAAEGGFQTTIGGECLDGYCSVTNHDAGHDCPPEKGTKTAKVAMQGCGSSGTPKEVDNLSGQMMYTSGANDEAGIFGHQNEAVYCQSQTTHWDEAVSGENNNGVNALFSTFFFDPYQEYQAIPVWFFVTNNQGTTFKEVDGRCIIGMETEQANTIYTSAGSTANNREGPHVTQTTNCVINEGGYYQYKQMDITWAVVQLDKNGDRDDLCVVGNDPDADGCWAIETVMLIPVQTRSIFQVAGCPSDGHNLMGTGLNGYLSKVCKGSINCDFETNWPCGHEFYTCIDTQPPTHEPSTAHGDPIIWTFGGECYDLHKDGMYKATEHPIYDHTVHMSVYNDYVREVQIHNKEGEILLSINNLGDLDNNWPYFISEEVKECPQDLYDCLGTYVEYIFDAQDFRYVVQILRHNYKDPALQTGEYGYHLDVRPLTYDRFEENKDGYSGLYFENPLPDELEYCEGGAPREY